MESEPHIDKLLHQLENVLRMPEGKTKRGLIDAAIDVVHSMRARDEITDDERKRLLNILRNPCTGNPFSEN